MTCTILCRDVHAGLIGGAVISHYPCVGAAVLAARQGVGVVAGQSFAAGGAARRGLELLALGHEPADVVSELRQGASASRWQFGVLDVRGTAGMFTGESCVPWAGGYRGDDMVVLGNMLAGPAVVEAAAEAFAQGDADIAGRLVMSLQAAENAGGDVRGPQSAALVLASIDGALFEQTSVHVDDHADPVAELARLVAVQAAHGDIAQASSLAASGGVDAARPIFERIQHVNGPGNLEPTVWLAIALARAGQVGEAIGRLDEVYRAAPRWREFVRRVCAVGIAPDGIDPATTEAPRTGAPSGFHHDARPDGSS